MSPPRPSVLRRASNCVAGLAAFAGACLAVQRFAPFPPVPVVGAKLAYFNAHAADFDTVFVGSSRVYRQIDPAIFDAEMRARGVSTRSFNFGAPAMIPPESFFVLEKILACKPPHLRRVFIEWAAVKTEIEKRRERTIEALYWHDATQTAFIARVTMDRFGWSRTTFLQKVWPHLRLFFRNSVNIGRGTDLVALSDFAERSRTEKGYARNAGYSAPREAPPAERSNAAAYGQTLATTKLQLEKRTASGENSRETPAVLAAVARIEASVRAAGAEPVWFIPPTLEPVTGGLFREDRSRAHVLFAFSRPDTFPQLYRLENRWDWEHLNEAGSREFTRLLAGRFADFLSGRENGGAR